MAVTDWLIGNANDVLLDSFHDEYTGAVENDVTAFLSLCTSVPVAIVGATNASPIVITTAGPHGRSTGDIVTIVNVGGNGAAKGTFTITVLTSTTFHLGGGSAGDGAYTGGGEVYVCIANASALPMVSVDAGSYLVSKDGTLPLVDGQQLVLVIYCLGTYRDFFNAILPVFARRRTLS